MKGRIIGAILCSATISACGGGGGSLAPTATSATSATAAGATNPGTSTGNAPGATTTATSATTFTVSIPVGTAASASTSTSASTRAALYVSPTTATVYVSLESTSGHGNPAFSFTEKISSANCTTSAGVETCSYAIAVPIGSDTFSILTTDAAGIPLGYLSATITVTAAGPNTLGPQGQLSPIIAKATGSYAFAEISGDNSAVPAVTVTPSDADGDPLTFELTGDAPLGDVLSSVAVSQSVGQFSEWIDAHGRIEQTSQPENAVSLASMGGIPYLIELGNGTTNAFTTKLTFTTPVVQYTQTEFPQLPTPAVSVPSSSSSLTLTCQFTSATPTTDPCPGTAPATINIF